MTQKELLYYEDAINHEDTLIKMCDLSSQNLNDETLVTFMNEEKEIHQKLKEQLINLLEVKSNE